MSYKESQDKLEMLNVLANNKFPLKANSNIKKYRMTFSYSFILKNSSELFLYLLGIGDPRPWNFNWVLDRRVIHKKSKHNFTVTYEFIPHMVISSDSVELSENDIEFYSPSRLTLPNGNNVTIFITLPHIGRSTNEYL